MVEPLDEQYLTWLYARIGSIEDTNPSRTYWKLLRQLFKTEFVWIIPNDDNRVEDGRDLRHEFLEQHNLQDVDPDWLGLGCSVLEMLIGLAHRLAFETEGDPRTWFWKLLDHLELGYYTDKHDWSAIEDVVSDILHNLIFRTYLPDGQGGLFPLKEPHEDQRHVEIWYQMSEYLIEHA